jgi:hypothetical protein
LRPVSATLLAVMINRDEADPRLSPISLRRELVGAGFTDKAIRRLVADGTLVRLRYGSYVSGATWRACDDVARHGLVARAVVRRAESEVVLSHVTAAGEWEVPLWDVDLGTVQVTRRDGKPGRRREAGVFQHVGALRDDDVADVNGVLVTSATRTAVDCMTVFDVEHGLATVNSMLRRGLTSRRQLHECAEFMSSWPGTLNHRVVLGLATPLTESVGEDRTLFLCWSQGLPAPVPQYEILDQFGNAIARVDFAWPELGVFVEFDGKVKYQPDLNDGASTTEVVLSEKRREERICELTGWACVRITWSDLAYPERTAARIRAKFGATSAAS